MFAVVAGLVKIFFVSFRYQRRRELCLNEGCSVWNEFTTWILW